MKDTTYTNQLDTVISLNDAIPLKQIVLHSKSENVLKSEDNNLSDIISVAVSIFIFALGYLFNSVSNKLKDKNTLRKKYKGWKADLKGIYSPILIQSGNIKEHYELLEREEWTLGYPKKMPPLFSYNLINFDKYEFLEALVLVEKLSRDEASEITTGMFLSIEKVKHYEKAFEHTIEFLSSKSIIIHEEFERTLLRLNNEVESILSSTSQQQLVEELGSLYIEIGQKSKSTEIELNPFVLTREYFEPLEVILHKYKSDDNLLYPAFSTLLELTTFTIRLKNERLGAIENLKLQFHEFIGIAKVIKAINEKLKNA